MLFKVINSGKRGHRKVVARPSVAARRAKTVRRKSGPGPRGPVLMPKSKRGPPRAKRAQRDAKGHFIKAKKNPARRYMPAVKRARAAVTKATNKSGTYSFGSLPKVNPRKRAKTGAGEKTMARKRGKKLTGKKKAAFKRRMAAGRRKAALKRGGSSVRRRRPKKGKRNPARVIRRRRGKRNGPALERAHKGASASFRKKPKRHRKARKAGRSAVARRRRSSGNNALVRQLTKTIAKISGGEGRKSKRRGKHRGIGVTARKMALQARRRVARGGPGVSAKARAYLKAHGLNKVNGGYSAIMEGFRSLPKALPEVLLGGVALTGVGALGNWLGGEVVKKYGASYAPWAAPVISLLGAVAGFLGLRAMKKPEWSNAWLVGGTGGALVNLYANNHVAPALGSPAGTAALSLGRTLMLPIGSVVSRSSTTQLGDFDPRARHRLAGEVVTRAMTVGEVVTRADAVNSLGESTEKQLNRLLGEISLEDDSSHGF